MADLLPGGIRRDSRMIDRKGAKMNRPAVEYEVASADGELPHTELLREKSGQALFPLRRGESSPANKDVPGCRYPRVSHCATHRQRESGTPLSFHRSGTSPNGNASRSFSLRGSRLPASRFPRGDAKNRYRSGSFRPLPAGSPRAHLRSHTASEGKSAIHRRPVPLFASSRKELYSRLLPIK